MLGAPRAALLGAAVVVPAPALQLVGAWPLDEASGTSFADSAGGNAATLLDPAGNATHVHARPAIRADGAGSLQLSDQYLEIPMLPAYQESAVSAVLWLQPRTRLRGSLHWQSDRADLRGWETVWSMGSEDGALFLKRVGLGLRGGVYQSGSVQWFGGAEADLATLAVDTAYRITATQGPDGARLYVDDALVASLPGLTLGWSGVTAPLRTGRHDATRRPPATGLGALVSDVRVYRGQLSAGEVSLLPAAASALPYTKPAALSGLPAFVVEDQAGANDTEKLQAAIDAASSAGGGWVTQSDPGTPLTLASQINAKADAHLWRIYAQATTDRDYWSRMFSYSESATGEGAFDSHGGAPHYLIGCRFDHRHRESPMLNNGNPGHRTLDTGDPDFGAPWPGTAAPDDREEKRWHFEQARILSIRATTSSRVHVIAQFCTFENCCSDALSVNENCRVEVEDCYAGRVRRGFLVQNGGNSEIVGRRCETESEYPDDVTSPPLIGTGITDVEPFNTGAGTSGRQTSLTLRDCWTTDDWDVQPEGPDSGTGGAIDMANTHMTKSTYVLWNPVGSHGAPVKSWATRGSTLRYAVDQGGGAASSVLRGARVSDQVIVLEDLLFVACGNFMHYHGNYRTWTTANVFALWHDPNWFGSVGPLTRIIYRRCRFEVENLPAGIAAGNVYCLRSGVVPAVGEDVEFEDCTLSSSFAQDRPFQWSGQRIFLTGAGVSRDDGRANGDLFQGNYTLG